MQCPNCHGFKVRSSKDAAGGKIALGVFLIIGIVGIPLIIWGIIQALMPTTYTCKQCGCTFRKEDAELAARTS
jgi:hypothetical protein